jgi:hypothetical protein
MAAAPAVAPEIPGAQAGSLPTATVVAPEVTDNVSPFGDHAAPLAAPAVSPFGDKAVAQGSVQSPFGDTATDVQIPTLRAMTWRENLQDRLHDLWVKANTGPFDLRQSHSDMVDIASQLGNVQRELINGALSPVSTAMLATTGGLGQAAKEGSAVAQVAAPLANKAILSAATIPAVLRLQTALEGLKDNTKSAGQRAAAIIEPMIPIILAGLQGGFGEATRTAGAEPVDVAGLKNVTHSVAETPAIAEAPSVSPFGDRAAEPAPGPAAPSAPVSEAIVPQAPGGAVEQPIEGGVVKPGGGGYPGTPEPIPHEAPPVTVAPPVGSPFGDKAAEIQPVGQAGAVPVVAQPPPGSTSAPPSLPFDEVKKQYIDAFAQSNKYTPDQVGGKDAIDKMAALADAYPDFIEHIDNGTEPPVLPGGGIVGPEVIEQPTAEPRSPPGPRWTLDPGAIPGEPSYFLDVPGGGALDEAKAAITEREVPGKGVLFDATTAGGESIGTFSTLGQVAKAAEASVGHGLDAENHPLNVLPNGEWMDLPAIGGAAVRVRRSNNKIWVEASKPQGVFERRGIAYIHFEKDGTMTPGIGGDPELQETARMALQDLVDKTSPKGNPINEGVGAALGSGEPETHSPLPPEAPTESEAANAPLAEPTPPEPEAPGESAKSVQQLRQEGSAITPREAVRTVSRISAIDKEVDKLLNERSNLAGNDKRTWARRSDLTDQANALLEERLEHQIRLGDKDAEAALQRWHMRSESGANMPSADAIILKFLQKNKLPSAKALEMRAERTGGKWSGMSGELRQLDAPKKFFMKDKDALAGGLSNTSLERWNMRLADELLGNLGPNPDVDPETGTLAAGEDAGIQLVGRALAAQNSGALDRRLGETAPQLPLKETPLLSKARELRRQAGFIYVPNFGTGRVSYAARRAIGELNAERQKIVNYWKAGDVRQAMAMTRDVAENKSKLYARQSSNDFRGDLERTYGKDKDLALDALTAVVEAGQGPLTGQQQIGAPKDVWGKESLKAMKADLEASTKADPYWKNRDLAAIDFAIKNYEYLSSLADDYNAVQDAEHSTENASGVESPTFQRYVFHPQDVDQEISAPSLMGGGTGNAQFRQMRVYPNYAASIAAGVNPYTLNAADLMETRLRIGANMVNNRAWLESLHDIVDPTNGQPVAAPMEVVKRPDGSTYTKAPDGYHAETMGGQQVAVQNGYAGIFSALSDPSRFADGTWGRLIQRGNATAKSMALLFDTFHLGRVAFWSGIIRSPLAGLTGSSLTGPSFARGVAMLDLSPQEFQRRIASGDIPARFQKQLIQDKYHLDKVIDHGLNVGRIADSLHQEWVRAVPGIGHFNKWVFEDVQRGAMAEIAMIEFKRQAKANPEWSEDQVAANVAREINTRFGSLGRQGWIKSQTGQDIARLLALAPQWNEGLVKSEFQGAWNTASAAAKKVLGRQAAVGLLGRSVMAAGIALFAANQLINLYTRGHPTWKNPEKTFGAKISAWIPDYIGRAMGHEGPGFFLNPMSLPAEISHVALTAYERTHDWPEAANDLLRGRASIFMRAILTAITGKNNLGRPTRPGHRIAPILASLSPAPLASPALVNAVRGIAGGGNREAFPGQFQKQLMQSFGIRTDQAPSKEQRIYGLAEEFNRTKGIQPSAEFYQGDYQPIVHALETGNNADAKDAMTALLHTKTPDQVFDHLTRWPLFPFTGQARREAGFVQTLNPEEKQAYDQAVENREAVAHQAIDLLHEVNPNAPTISGPEYDRLMGVMKADKVASLQSSEDREAAKGELQRILALPPAERGPELEKLKQDPVLDEEVNRQFKEQTRGLTVVEKHIQSLPVATGARAEYIFNEATKIPAGPERAAYIQNLKEKNIWNDRIEGQIGELMQGRPAVGR